MRKGGDLKCPQNRAKPIGAGLGPAGVVREGSAPTRLPDELDKEYLWFQAYWREGAARSLREMAARMGVVPSTLARTRIRQRWDARIQAALEEPPEVKQGWLARREALREAEWKLHQECLEAGREALRNWRESGKTATLGDLVKLLEFGAKLARLSAGMPDNHTMITGEEGEPIRVQFEAALAQAYGPVVDAVSEVVEVQSEGSLNGKGDREAGEIRGESGAGEGCPGGEPEVCGAGAGTVRSGESAAGVAGEGDSRPEQPHPVAVRLL